MLTIAQKQIFIALFILATTLFSPTNTAPLMPSKQHMIQSFTQFFNDNMANLHQHKQRLPNEINQENVASIDLARLRYLVRKVALSLKVLRLYMDDAQPSHHATINTFTQNLEDEIDFFNQARCASINIVSKNIHELQTDPLLRPLTREYQQLLDEKTALHYTLVQLPSL